MSDRVRYYFINLSVTECGCWRSDNRDLDVDSVSIITYCLHMCEDFHRFFFFFFFQAEDGIRDLTVTGVQTCALPIWLCHHPSPRSRQGSGGIAPCAQARWCGLLRRAAGHQSTHPALPANDATV